MNEQLNARILQNRTFKLLIRRRAAWATWLSLAVFAGYYGLLTVIAASPETLHAPISARSPISLGWMAGSLLIVGAWILTGLYVYKANSEFDDLNEKLLKEVA